MQEVCLRRWGCHCPLLSQQPVTEPTPVAMRPWTWGSRFWRWLLPWWLFLLLPAWKARHCHTMDWNSNQRKCKDQGVQERSRGPLGSVACLAHMNIWLPFRDERKEAQGHRTVSGQLPHFSSPLPLPSICSTVKFLPMAFPGHEPLHRAERRAGTRLVTHPCPRVTKLKFCLYIHKLARFKFTWMLPSQLCTTTCGEA